MVAPENDDGVLREFEPLKFIEGLANLRIEVADIGVIPVADFADIVRRQLSPLFAQHLPAVVPHHARGVLRPIGRIRHRNVFTAIVVPVSFRRVEWRVRFPKTDGEEKRLWVLAPCTQGFDSQFCHTPSR